MLRCSSCAGLVPNAEKQCVHCGAELRRKRRNGAIAVAASLLAASTVNCMGAYGLPPCDDKQVWQTSCQEPIQEPLDAGSPDGGS